MVSPVGSHRVRTNRIIPHLTTNHTGTSALKTTIETDVHINNSQFATLVAVTNLMNTILCIAIGFVIDRFGGPVLSVWLAGFHLVGSLIQAGSATNGEDSYAMLIVGKVIAAIGDGSLDNAQHRIFTTYFAPGHGYAFSIGIIWAMANLAQFVGQATANIIATNLGSYAWPLWISAVVSLISMVCACGVWIIDKYLRKHYIVLDHSGKTQAEAEGRRKRTTFQLSVVRRLPLTFWLVVVFAVFENAGVQSFVSISTQFTQQRLQKGAVIGGWVSSMYLLLPVGLTPLLGLYIDRYGQRMTWIFASGVIYLVSMLVLRLSTTVPPFIFAYILYALAQTVTPAPQVEIVRNIIPDPSWYATAFAVKKSVVQGSIVIITTAAGKIQDDSSNHESLAGAVTLWAVYGGISVAISGFLLISCYTDWGMRYLPAARLSQVRPKNYCDETNRLWEKLAASPRGGVAYALSEHGADAELTRAEKARILKGPEPTKASDWGRQAAMWFGIIVVVIGWIVFGLGVMWGVQGSVISGSVGW